MLLELAEAQARDLDMLEAMVDPDQPLGVVRECRNQRIALGRLIGLVDVPGEISTGSLHAEKAARARWQGWRRNGAPSRKSDVHLPAGVREAGSGNRSGEPEEVRA